MPDWGEVGGATGGGLLGGLGGLATAYAVDKPFERAEQKLMPFGYSGLRTNPRQPVGVHLRTFADTAKRSGPGWAARTALYNLGDWASTGIAKLHSSPQVSTAMAGRRDAYNLGHHATGGIQKALDHLSKTRGPAEAAKFFGAERLQAGPRQAARAAHGILDYSTWISGNKPVDMSAVPDAFARRAGQATSSVAGKALANSGLKLNPRDFARGNIQAMVKNLQQQRSLLGRGRLNKTRSGLALSLLLAGLGAGGYTGYQLTQ